MTTELAREGVAEKLNDPLRRKIEQRVLLVFLLSSAFSLALLENRMAWGVVAGGAVGWFSFRSLRRTLEKGFSFILSKKGSVGAFVAIKYYLKLILTFLVLGYLLKEGKVDAIGIVVGLLVVPISLIFTGIDMRLNYMGGKNK